jgi:uncharacterized OB-fold protein
LGIDVTSEPGLVLPTITDENRPFWDGCAAGELRLQKCARCGHVRYPVAPECPLCLAPEHAWRTLSGRAEIVSWVYFQRAYNRAWAGRVPYNVILVELEEGPRMFSNAVPLDRSDLRVGMPVAVTFADEEGVSIPRFAPIQDPSQDS